MIVYHCFLLGVLYHSYLLGETAAGMEGVDRDFVMVECGTLRLRGASSSVESPLWPDIVVSPSCERDFWKRWKKLLVPQYQRFLLAFLNVFHFFQLLLTLNLLRFFIFFKKGRDVQHNKGNLFPVSWPGYLNLRKNLTVILGYSSFRLEYKTMTFQFFW